MEKYNSGLTDIFKIEIDAEAKSNFLEMARWTKFLAILGFIMLSLLLIIGVFFSMFMGTFAQSYGSNSPFSSLGAAGPAIVIAIFAVLIGVYIYPTYALLKYATNIKSAITTNNREQFNRAIKYLKGMFKYIGILMIIFLALYAFEIVAAIITVMVR